MSASHNVNFHCTGRIGNRYVLVMPADTFAISLIRVTLATTEILSKSFLVVRRSKIISFCARFSMLTSNFLGELSIRVLDFNQNLQFLQLALRGRWPTGFVSGFRSPPFALFWPSQ